MLFHNRNISETGKEINEALIAACFLDQGDFMKISISIFLHWFRSFNTFKIFQNGWKYYFLILSGRGKGEPHDFLPEDK